jgi:hypothetical protein
MKDTISSKDLKKCAKAASKRAVERAQARKIPYTVQKGRNIVEHRADGSTKVVGILSKAFVKPAAKLYRVA